MIVEKTFKILIISSFFIITLGFISSDFIIISLYSSSYANSAAIFQILVFTLISTYPNYLLGSSLFSLNRQNSVLRIGILALLINLLLNILLIPTLGGQGAALAALISGITILFGYIWYLKDRINSFYLISVLTRTFLISSFLIILNQFVKDIYPLYFNLPVIAIAFIVLTYIFKLINRDEIERLRDLVTNILNRT